MRGLPGPVFFPIRGLATMYVDIFRALPGILVIYVLGFGIPGLDLPGVPSDPLLLGDRRADPDLLGLRVRGLPLRHRIGPPEPGRGGPVTRAVAFPGAPPRHPAAGRPAGRRRRLLNDFIGLQKDTVLVSFIGVVEIFRTAQIKQPATFNFTPYLGVALVFIVVTIPLARFTDWLVARDRQRSSAGGAR